MTIPAMEMEQTMSKNRVATHALFGVLILIYLALFWTTLIRLAGVWAGDGTFQYAFLVPPISLFLVISRRDALAEVPFKLSWLGVILVAACSLLWMLGTLVGVQLAQQLAVIAVIPSLVLAVYGPAVVRKLVFPLTYLFFALPLPVGRLIVILQHITAEFAVHTLQFTGFVAYLNGVLIETPVATWHVEVACSGIKFFVAMLALGLLYAYLFFHSWVRRTIFVALAFVVPILSNGLRVYFTVVIGEVFGVQYATGTDHLIFGWQFFGSVLLVYFLAGWRWREMPPVPEASDRAVTAGAYRSHWSGLLTTIVLLSGPGMAWALDAASPPVSTSLHQASRIGSWQLLLPQANPLGAHFWQADSQLMATYARGMDQVNVIQVTYDGRPRHGHKLFQIQNYWYDSKAWNVKSAKRLHFAVGSGKPWLLHEVTLSGSGQERLVWYWYAVGGRVMPSLVDIKLQQLRDGLMAKPLSTRLVVLSTPLQGNAQRAAARLNRFLHVYAKASASSLKAQA